MWAKIIDKDKGFFELDSIPFYAPNIASGDIIRAQFDPDEKMLTYQETVQYSGNSTVQVVIMDKSVVTNDIRDVLSNLGCVSEKFSEGYFVLEVPSNVDYNSVKKALDGLAQKGIIDYAEPCLSGIHRDASSH